MNTACFLSWHLFYYIFVYTGFKFFDFGANVKGVVVDQTLHAKLLMWLIAKFYLRHFSMSWYCIGNGMNFCLFSSLSGYLEWVSVKSFYRDCFTEINERTSTRQGVCLRTGLTKFVPRILQSCYMIYHDVTTMNAASSG